MVCPQDPVDSFVLPAFIIHSASQAQFIPKAFGKLLYEISLLSLYSVYQQAAPLTKNNKPLTPTLRPLTIFPYLWHLKLFRI